MKEGYKFVFVTNCSSMGDCKNFDAQFYNCLKNKQFFNIKHDGSELKTNALKKTERKKANPSASVPFDTTKCGKVGRLKRAYEITIHFNCENRSYGFVRGFVTVKFTFYDCSVLSLPLHLINSPK